MTTLNFEIKTYTVMLGKTIGVGMTNLNYAPAVINCQGVGGEQLVLTFAPTQAAVDQSANFTDIGSKRGGIVAPMSSFGAFLDVLRNEAPIYAQIDSTSPNTMNVLKTGLEPVGDTGK